MTECDKCKTLRIGWKHGMCPCECHLKKKKHKFLPDISNNWMFYRTLFTNDLGKKKYDECRKSLIELNGILGDDYRVKLTGDLWADMELLLKAQDDYRREYTDRHDEFRF